MADTAKPTTVQVEPAGAVGAAAAADDDAALLAELEAETGGKPAKPAKAKAPAKAKPAVVADEEPDADEPAAEPADDEPDDDAAPDEDGDPDAEDDVDEDAEPDDEDADDEDGDPDAEDDAAGAAKDPELAKRHAALRRTEERQRQKLEQDRAALERERSTWQAETKQTREAVDRIKGLVARAKIDPAAVLEAFGLSPEDMEYAGQQCYARGKSAAGKPEYRAAAERAARERELAESAATNAKRIADLEAKLEGKETQAAEERELDAYFARVARKATDATPITARLIAKRPQVARAELAVTAAKLAAKLGRMPKVAELLAAHERREVRALKLRGIEPPTPGAGKPAAAAPAATATGKAAAKPGGKPAKPAAKPDTEIDETTIPSTADLVRELQASN